MLRLTFTALIFLLAGNLAFGQDWDTSLKADAIPNGHGFLEANTNDGSTFVNIPGGTFTMGNNDLGRDSSPEHKVTLSPYWIAKMPVTIEQFRTFIKETGFVTDAEKPGAEGPWVYDYNEQGFIPKKGYNWRNCFDDIIKRYPEIPFSDQHPVACVSWNDAIAYTHWLSKKTGLPITLPTEAQWEYAARGTDGRIYPWGNTPSDGTKANYADDSFGKYFAHIQQSLIHHGINDGYPLTSPVGSYPAGASPFGVLDMAGNLVEWMYNGIYDYTEHPLTNPENIEGRERMEKGGDWSSSAGRMGAQPDEIQHGHNVRADARQGDELSSSDDHMGFRVAIFPRD